MALLKHDDIVTIFIPGAHLTPQYVITPPLGMTKGEPKERWIELKDCKSVDEHPDGVYVTANSKVFISRGIEISTYENDFHEWTQEQARLLRSGRFSQLDIENVAEELESMGRRDKREIDSRLEVLLIHLLKWKLQEGFRSGSWSGSIREQRSRIEDLLRESPRLRRQVAQIRPALYARARREAANETGLPVRMFPARCPFTPEQIMAEDFLPED
jgi:hypothetical protein